MRWLIILLAVLLWAPPARAADPDWKAYGALQKLHELGYDINFIGETGGYQGWFVQKPAAGSQSDMRMLYTRPGQQIVISGLLFDKDGNNVTTTQLQTAVKQGRIKNLPTTAAAAKTPAAAPAGDASNYGAQLYDELAKAHTINIGNDPKLPTLYVFVDPRCPFCKQFWQATTAALTAGVKFNVKLIVVGILGDKSAAAASAIMAAPDPAAAWRANEDGTAPAGPGTAAAQKLVDDNQNIMLRWGITSVPFTVYRTPAHDVKILRGLPADYGDMLVDMGALNK